jgi:hypothetical protein
MPTVTAVSPAKVKSGDTVTITGTKFGTDTSKLTVKFGGVAGTVTGAADTTVTVTAPDQVASAAHAVTVNVSDYGDAQATGMTVEYEPVVTALSPNTGSLGGYEQVTVSGSGFHPKTTIDFGGTACTPIGAVSPSTFKCKMGAKGSAGNTSGIVTTEYVDTANSANNKTYTSSCSGNECKFNFDASLTVTLTSVTPTTLPSASERLTIAASGGGLGTDTAKVKVTVGETVCTVATLTDI